MTGLRQSTSPSPRKRSRSRMRKLGVVLGVLRSSACPDFIGNPPFFSACAAEGLSAAIRMLQVGANPLSGRMALVGFHPRAALSLPGCRPTSRSQRHSSRVCLLDRRPAFHTAAASRQLAEKNYADHRCGESGRRAAARLSAATRFFDSLTQQYLHHPRLSWAPSLLPPAYRHSRNAPMLG